ncbi:MAG: ferric reductase-like transmembrane domain-containing protein [Microbacteriaceae bacterium]
MALLYVDHPVASVAPVTVADQRRVKAHRRRVDAWQVLAVVTVFIPIAMYLSQGATTMFSTPGDAVYAFGVIAGLIGTQLCLLMLLLAARVPAIERVFGQDRSISLHSKLGKPVFYLLIAHGVLLMIGAAMQSGVNVVVTTLDFLSDSNYLLATIGLALFAVVAVTSFVAVKRTLQFEVWHAIHLLSYIAVGIALPHQFVTGGVFGTGWALGYWAALYAITALCLLWFRFTLPVARSLRHELRVSRVERLGPDVVSVYVTGRQLQRLAAEGGQYLHWRFWTPSIWWQSHPYSLSAAPVNNELRITVRGTGAGSAALLSMQPGTRVGIAGPYGRFTAASRTKPRVALLGAGMGIAPIRAVMDELPPMPGRLTVILRSHDAEQTWLLNEIIAQAERLGGRVIVLAGRRADGDWRSAEAVRQGFSLGNLVPAIAETDFYVCGPTAWTDAVGADARAYGATNEQIHAERFNW